MVSDYTREEREALHEKMDHPETKVICPRCGKELGYKDAGCAWQVKCQTPDCIQFSLRGL